jgi:hypothetical protein
MTESFRKNPFPRRKSPVLFLLFFLFVSLEGCATDGNSRPVAPFQNRQGAILISDTFFFGLSTSRGPVSQIEWDTFLRDVVTPRFPDGLTYWEANGQWRGSRNEIVRERTMVLQIIHPDNFQNESAVQEMIGRYKAQFEQDSVLRLRDAVQVWY